MLTRLRLLACAAIFASACSFHPNASTGDGGFDPPSVTVGFQDSSRLEDESSGTIAIPVVLSAPSELQITVDYTISDGSAIRDFDYTASNGTLVFAPGETRAEIALTILTDALEEPGETIALALKSPTGPGVLGVSAETITINSDILPRVSFSVMTSSAMENATATLTATLDVASTVDVTVDYAVTGTSTAADRALADGTLTFPAGTLTKQLDLQVVDDVLNEDDETAIVSLANPVHVVLGTVHEQTHTILDNDPMPSIGFTASTSSQGEAVAQSSITVALSAVSGRVVTVMYAATGGTAGTGDYTVANPGMLTFPPGVTTQTIPLTVIDDTLDEANETAQITLSAPNHATLAAAGHTLTIVDDDAAPSVSFQTAASTVVEGNTTVTLTVVLSAASGQTITVPFSRNGASTAGPADFTFGTASPLSFPPGSTSRTISIDVTEDTLNEDDEVLQVDLGAPTNATLGMPSSYALTITDDDALPFVQFFVLDGDGSQNEGDSGSRTFDYTVTLSTASGRTVVVPINFSGNASDPSDYTVGANDVPVVFTPGQTSRTIQLKVTGDHTNEQDETITMTIPNTGITNAQRGIPATRNHTIRDDD